MLPLVALTSRFALSLCLFLTVPRLIIVYFAFASSLSLITAASFVVCCSCCRCCCNKSKFFWIINVTQSQAKELS